jgi:hypothetical protein
MLIGAAKTTAPEQVLADGVLRRLTLDVDSAAVVLGGDSAGRPVRLRLFRPAPTTVTFVGGWWAAQVLVFRCLALGAIVAVCGPEDADWLGADSSPAGALAPPGHWIALDMTAGGAGNRVFPIAGEHPVGLPANPTRPVLLLYDVGPVGPSSRPVLGAWQTQLTVLARSTAASVHALAMADLVLAQRLSQAEAAVVGSALVLDQETASLLGVIDDEMVAVLGGGANQPAWFMPTAIERQLFGGPVR